MLSVGQPGGASSFVLRGLRLFVSTLAVGALAGSAFAKTIYVTPYGEGGYLEGARQPIAARAYGSAALVDLALGDIVQLLPTSPDPAAVTVFAGRLELRQVRAAAVPVVIRGMGNRTRIIGRGLEALRCPMPETDVRGCKGDKPKTPAEEAIAAASLHALGQSGDLLANILASAPSPPPPFAGLGDPALLAINPFPKPGVPGRLTEAACIDLIGVEGIILENLDLRDCWLSAVRTRASRHVTLRNSFIVGSSYGLAVRGQEPGEGSEEEASHISVEGVTWIQDASGYGSGDPTTGECLAGRSRGDACPGDLWRSVPWGVAHHGAFEHLNGALLGGRNIKSDVVFRGNTIWNAYNGIRLTARPCSEALLPGQPPRSDCSYNARVTVEGNLFSYVRDNPVELEDWATDVFIIGNRIRDAHAWLSFDGMGGGPVYVYGNVGWFDDRPSLAWSDDLKPLACRRNEVANEKARYRFDPELDRRYDYVAGQWLKIGETKPGELGDAGEMRCETSTLGRALKFSLPDEGAERGSYNFPFRGPIYVFNNSWYLRAPITGSGAPANLRHWNNAILFCENGVPGFGDRLCDPLLPPEPADCGAYSRPNAGLGRYVAVMGRIPFFECFRWRPFDEAGRDVAGLDSSFDWDVSGNGFPDPTRVPAAFEQHGRRADPGFMAPHLGDLRLRSGAAAAQSGCLVERAGDELRCREVEPGLSYAGAYAPDGRSYPGPRGLSPPH